jgi:hypothetical protein
VPTLDRRFRCMGCGLRLGEDPTSTCASCGAELDAVGRWSELLEWGETRKQGRVRFLIRKTAIDGGAIASLTLLCRWLAGFWRGPIPGPTFWILAVLLELLTVFVVAWLHWRSAEREYAEAGAPTLDPNFTGHRP